MQVHWSLTIYYCVVLCFLQSLKSFFKELSCTPVSKVKDGSGI